MVLIRATTLCCCVAAGLLHFCDAITAITNEEKVGLSNRVVEWVRSKGGFFHAGLEFRPLDPSNPASGLGLFTNEKLSQAETLMIVPSVCLLTAGESQDTCDTVRNLLKERHLEEQSAFKPYLDFVYSGMTPLPSAWSKEGRDLIDEVLGIDLWPESLTDSSFADTCENDATTTTTEEQEEAFLLVLRRSWDDVMVPLLDMPNHRNGPWLNTDNRNSVHSGEDIVVVARRDIEADEQLYMSYNECFDCDFALTFVLPDILKDYGFVEQYPQRWKFPSVDHVEDLVIELDQKPDDDDNSSELEVRWLTHDPEESDIVFLRGHLRRIRAIKKDVVMRAAKLPTNERDTILEFYHALKTVLEHAVWHAEEAILVAMQ